MLPSSDSFLTPHSHAPRGNVHETIMTIQYKFFTIPIKATQEVETERNRFLRSQRVLTVHREFGSLKQFRKKE